MPYRVACSIIVSHESNEVHVGFLGVILKNRVKTKSSEGIKIDRSRFPKVLRWFLTLLVSSHKIYLKL